MHLDPEQCIVERADVIHAKVYDCFQSGYCGSSCGRLRWPCRRSMSWKGCRCRRRRHARALQTIHFCWLVVSWQVSYICQSFKNKKRANPVGCLGIQAGDFFPRKPQPSLPGDDEGEEVFDLRKVRSMEKSSGEMRSGNVFFGRLLVDDSMFYGKTAFLERGDETPILWKKQIPSIYMKLLFVFFGWFLRILPWD